MFFHRRQVAINSGKLHLYNMKIQDCFCLERDEVDGNAKLTEQMQTVCRQVGRELRSRGDTLENLCERPLRYNDMIDIARNLLDFVRFIFFRCVTELFGFDN